MSPVRNACVVRGVSTAGGVFNVYRVPAGNVLLMKAMVINNADPSPQAVNVSFQNQDGSTQVLVIYETLNPNTPRDWQTWHALNAGDSIIMGFGHSNISYWVSGALLPYNTALG